MVQTALGISPYTSAEPIDQQATLLSAQLNLSDFQNPTKLQNFIERFAAMYDAKSSSSESSGTGSSSSAGSSSADSNVVLLDASNNASDGIVAIDPNLLIQLGAQGLSL